MTISEIAKNTLISLKNQALQLTPENYSQVFCQEAKKGGINHTECQKLQNFMAKLTPDLQKKASSYTIKTAEELVTFLIAQANRSAGAESSSNAKETNIYTKKLLRIIALLKNRRALNIAQTQSSKLGTFGDAKALAFFTAEWERFEAGLDYASLSRLDAVGRIRKDDLLEMVEDILANFSKKEYTFAVDGLARIILEALTPSISAEFNRELDIVRARLSENPKLLGDENFLFELRILLGKRVAVDRQNVKNQIRSVDIMVDKVSERIGLVLESQSTAQYNINALRGEVKAMMKHESASFEDVKSKLETLLESVARNTSAFGVELKNDAAEMEQLKSRITELENELDKALKAAHQDFLTKILNRQGIDYEINKWEERFFHDKSPYCMVMFDLDHFKSVNDTYGHDAGDLILKSFAEILRRSARAIDIVGRLGGEEFVVMLNGIGKEGALRFTQKIAETVKKTSFMYKEIRIGVTFSAGISERKERGDLHGIYKLTDERLYEAKNKGRDTIVIE